MQRSAFVLSFHFLLFNHFFSSGDSIQVHCVDLGESFPTSIYLQNSASIQPRTSPSKFGGQFNSLFIRLLNDHGGNGVPDFRVMHSSILIISERTVLGMRNLREVSKPSKHGGFWAMCTEMCTATSPWHGRESKAFVSFRR